MKKTQCWSGGYRASFNARIKEVTESLDELKTRTALAGGTV